MRCKELFHNKYINNKKYDPTITTGDCLRVTDPQAYKEETRNQTSKLAALPVNRVAGGHVH